MRKQVAAMIAVLDGVDLVVFTGGIGENDGEARAAICGGLSWIGISHIRTRTHDYVRHGTITLFAALSYTDDGHKVL